MELKERASQISFKIDAAIQDIGKGVIILTIDEQMILKAVAWVMAEREERAEVNFARIMAENNKALIDRIAYLEEKSCR